MPITPIEFHLYAANLTTKLAVLPVKKGHIYQELQEPGSGEIHIPLDSNAAQLISSGQFCAFYYRDAIRGGFFVDHIKEAEVNTREHEGRMMSISGRGLLSVLEDAIIWDNGSGASVRSFQNVTKAYILETLLDEAISRGAFVNFTYNFSATTSSDSQAWTDSEDYDLTVGMSMLDVIRLFAATGEIEFGITLQGGSLPILLSAYKNSIGSDKSGSVFMRVGYNCVDVASEERSDEIKNVFLVKHKNGYITLRNNTSISTYRRREEFLNIEAAQSGDSASTFAAVKLDNQKDPRVNFSLEVYDGVSPYLFTDYEVGDIITVDRFGQHVSYRVLGIQADLDGEKPFNVVVDLNTIFYDNELRITNELDLLLKQWNTAKDANLTEVKQWLSIGSPNGEVYATHYYNGYLYVGGSFTAITGRLTTTNIARYNVSTGAWEAMDTGITIAPVVSIVEHSGSIYAATQTRVYRWTGAVWSLIGTTSGIIKTMASFGANLYVGGQVVFDVVGGLTQSIAYWDGSTPWKSSLVFTQVCFALAVYNNDLYAGFNTSTGGALRRRNGGVWSTVMTTPTNGTNIKALVAVGDDLVYSGGAASTARVYKWDGVSATREDLFSVTTWGDPGGGSHDVLAAYLSDIYFGSVFTTVNSEAGYGNIVRYSGGIYNDLQDGTSTAVGDRVNAITVINSDVYVAGKFSSIGGKTISNLGVWITTFQSLVDHLQKNSSFDMGAAIHAAPASAITDNDEVPFWEDTAQALRKITWANIKSTLITLFDTLYGTLAGLTDVDLTDLDNGDVLQYDSDENTWYPVPPFAHYFTDLSDTPGTLTGEGEKILRVNSAANAIEFVTGPTLGTNANDIFRVNFCGTSGWTGTINGAPSGAVVTYTNVSGNKNTLIPNSTSELGKQRLYNLTRGNYALISTSNGTSTITLTANAPANWASGDTITTLSITVSGSGRNWVEVEVTSGLLLNKVNGLFSLTLHEPGVAAGLATMWMHPTESYADSKVFNIINVAPNATASALMAMKLTNNTITASWTASGAATAIPIIRQIGFL